MNNETVKLNQETQSLLNQVNKFFAGNVSVQVVGSTKSGYVRHDQAHAFQDHNNLFIQVNDLTEPNFVTAHELLHVLMTLRGFPELFFPLTTGDEQLDKQLMYIGTELFDSVAHFVVYDEQRKHGMVNETIKKEVLKGVRHTALPEGDKVDEQMTLRLITVLDALVFFTDENQEAVSLLKKDYPITFDAAEKLYRLLLEKPVTSPFSMRRNVVKLFRAFDEQMKEWGLPELSLNDFAMVNPVFSKRQLKLAVHQVFNVYHSQLKQRKNGKEAYVGFTKGDSQNSFVAGGPADAKLSQSYLEELKNEKVQDLFQDLKIPYLIR